MTERFREESLLSSEDFVSALRSPVPLLEQPAVQRAVGDVPHWLDELRELSDELAAQYLSTPEPPPELRGLVSLMNVAADIDRRFGPEPERPKLTLIPGGADDAS